MLKNFKSEVSRISIMIMCFILCINMTGCSLKPTYYSKKDVKKYVRESFGKDYKLKDSKSYEDTNNKGQTMIYEYVFENKEKHRFSVYSSTIHSGIDGGEQFYCRSLKDDYVKSLYEENKDEIEDVCKESNLKTKLGENSYVDIYIDNYEQLKEAGKIVSEIDKIMDLKYHQKSKESYGISHNEFAIILYYNQNEDGKMKETEIGRLELTNNPEDRWTESSALEKFERLFKEYTNRKNDV